MELPATLLGEPEEVPYGRYPYSDAPKPTGDRFAVDTGGSGSVSPCVRGGGTAVKKLAGGGISGCEATDEAAGES